MLLRRKKYAKDEKAFIAYAQSCPDQALCHTAVKFGEVLAIKLETLQNIRRGQLLHGQSPVNQWQFQSHQVRLVCVLAIFSRGMGFQEAVQRLPKISIVKKNSHQIIVQTKPMEVQVQEPSKLPRIKNRPTQKLDNREVAEINVVKVQNKIREKEKKQEKKQKQSVRSKPKKLMTIDSDESYYNIQEDRHNKKEEKMEVQQNKTKFIATQDHSDSQDSFVQRMQKRKTNVEQQQKKLNVKLKPSQSQRIQKKSLQQNSKPVQRLKPMIGSNQQSLFSFINKGQKIKN